MQVILSKTLENKFKNFTVVDSFKKLRTMSNITTLVINSFVENDFDAGVFISDLKTKGEIKNFFYINSELSTTIVMLIKGMKGHISEEEWYLEDEEELKGYIDSVTEEEEDASSSLPALGVVDQFIQGFVKGDSEINTPLYLQRVKVALNELNEITHKQEVQISTMGESAIEVFESASKIIRAIDAQKREIEKQLSVLETKGNETASNMFSNTAIFFQPYRYMNAKKVLVIKEYSPCRYLTSFVYNYVRHLHYDKNKRVKLIIVHQKGANVSAKYSNITNITSENCGQKVLYNNEYIATNNPKKEVMSELLTDCEYFVVLDRLYLGESIVTGKVNIVNAVSGVSDIKRYHLDIQDTIFSVTNYKNCLLCIPVIKNFPVEEDARRAMYTQTLSKGYEVLDKRIGVE